MEGQSAPASQRPPTPRPQGVQHFVDATVELLAVHPPELLTTRMIAERAGHHHRFIQEWFGGKAGLLRAAVEQISTMAAADERPALFDESGGLRPEVVLAVRVLAWLHTHAPEQLEGSTWPLRERAAAVYVENLGLSQDVADLLARRLMAVVIGAVLYPGLTGIDGTTIGELRSLELRSGLLLAEEERAITSSGAASP